ncbi:hypothetical protein PYCCODRAFT_909889 [Trametes coccinea BRFM310]|uniref:Uncharacterized protein n=1 Tax=Trametes coccinea (strain BRFM310) TaxID=1353009 RepID=A0A1Y2IEG5_TRAC3|nr:hypothetical protein PYCCODRAFT_909889 [Trametes coccinea BRFM310]
MACGVNEDHVFPQDSYIASSNRLTAYFGTLPSRGRDARTTMALWRPTAPMSNRPLPDLRTRRRHTRHACATMVNFVAFADWLRCLVLPRVLRHGPGWRIAWHCHLRMLLINRRSLSLQGCHASIRDILRLDVATPTTVGDCVHPIWVIAGSRTLILCFGSGLERAVSDGVEEKSTSFHRYGPDCILRVLSGRSRRPQQHGDSDAWGRVDLC